MLTRRLATGLLLAAPWTARGMAQSPYPNHAVKMIIPFPAGGPTDIVGRLLGRAFEERLKAPFVVDNRGGAGGTIGLGAVAHAPPDGYTLAISASGALAMLPHLMPNMPFDYSKDFTAISMVMTVPQVLAVSKRLGVKSVEELIALAKAKPGKLTYGSSGVGTSLQFSAELFKLRAGNLNIVHVPYRGVAPALTDLMGGQIDMLFGDVPVMLPHADGGDIIPIGLTAGQRLPSLPNVPTLAESGVKDAESYTFYALVGPAGMTADLVSLLNTTLLQTLSDPQTRKILTDQGGIIIGGSPDECRTFIEAENKKWGEVARLAGIKME